MSGHINENITSHKFIGVLDLLLQEIEGNPNLLDHDDWPEFAQPVVSKLSAMLSAKPVPRRVIEGESIDVEEVDTEQEITALYEEIKTFKDKLDPTEDTTGFNTYFRVAASLLEKLVDLKEKAKGHKAYDNFVEVVISIHEELLTKDQSEEFRRRLEEHM